MEAETRNLVLQHAVLAKNSVVITRGKNVNKGENAETGYTLKKGKNAKTPKSEKKNNPHYSLSYAVDDYTYPYSSCAATSPGRKATKNILAGTPFLTWLSKFVFSKNLFALAVLRIRGITEKGTQ